MSEDRLDRAFARFHAAHPDVYRLFCQFVEELVRAGRKRYGAKGIFERVRWHYATSSSKPFKVDNSYTSRYVRLYVAEHPVAAGFFEMRQLKKERV